MTPEELDHTPLTFGQYKGQTPSQIAEHDPEYLIYAATTWDKPIASDVLIKACKDEL